mgnify:CR=1 FL=1
MVEKESAISPSHYKQGGLEVIDIWRAKLDPEELVGFFKANVLKYVMRADKKNGLEDYEKAAVYLKWIIEEKEKSGEVSTDKALRPEHYKQGGMQPIDIFRAKLTAKEFKGFCKANIIKYVLRADYKNGLEDYKKALVYLNWIIEEEQKKVDATKENK